MAAKYGSLEYDDTVIGLELVNEPISQHNNTFSTIQSWVADTFIGVKASTTNPNLTIKQDAFEALLTWTSVAENLSSTAQFAIDTHLHQLFTDADNALTQAQYIIEACSWASNLTAVNVVVRTFVGEWSAATNICMNPDGSTIASMSCSVPNCQCQSANFGIWNDALIKQAQWLVEAQLDICESSSSGFLYGRRRGREVGGF
jgi:glucan 1,3-beta-glucosidase